MPERRVFQADPKQPQEEAPIAVDFAASLGAGETIQSVTVKVLQDNAARTDKTTEMLVGTPQISGTVVTATITGGSDLTDYLVTFTARLTPTTRDEGAVVLLPVRDRTTAATQLVSVDRVLIELGLDESHYPLVERLVRAASQRAEQFCGTILRARSITQTLDGTDHPLLNLGAPIVSVASVTLDGQALTEAAQDFEVLAETGYLERDAGWGRGIRSIVVTATLGRDPIPPDVEEAVIELVRHWHADKTSGATAGVASERIGDYSYTRATPREGSAGLPDAVADLLLPYRRWL